MGMHSKCLVMVVGEYGTITLINLKYHGDYHVVFFCVYVCVKNWAMFCSEYLKEQGLLARTRHSLEYNIKMDL